MNINNSNYIQYIPFFIVLKAKPFTQKTQDPLAHKTMCCELLFTTCFMTELIYKSFPQYQKIKLKMSKYRDSLDSRMSGFNMLCSLLSIKNILDQSVMHKCLNLIIDCFERSMSNPGQRKELQQFYKEIDMQDCIIKDDQANCIAVQHYYSKLFHHCMV